MFTRDFGTPVLVVIDGIQVWLEPLMRWPQIATQRCTNREL